MSTSAQENVALVIEDHYVEVEKSVAELLKEPPVTVTIDGKKVEVPRTTLATNPATNQRYPRPTTIYDAALQVGVKIPILCHREHMTPVAVCRFCCVEVKGQWRLAPACQRQVEAGMEVNTHATSDRVKNAVKVLTELLISDHEVPRQAHKEYGENELQTLAKQFCPQGSRFRRSVGDKGQDESSMVIAVDHNACILCDRCVRACNDIRDNQVIGRMNKGYKARIAFDLNDPMGQSSCVSCGECMVSCPTGALTNRKLVEAAPSDAGGQGASVQLDELTKHPLFQGVSKQFLGWNEKSVVRRTLQPGEILCREGDFGNTAFIIEKGEFEIYISSPIKHAGVKKDHKRKPGLFSIVKRFVGLYDRNEDKREDASPPRYIPVDAPVSLNSEKPVAKLTPADLIFGEMSCMNNNPRSATVKATTPAVVLEIMRNVLYVLQRNKKSKEMLDRVYRDRAIDGHLRSVKTFSPLIKDDTRFKQFVNRFKEQMSLVRLNPGEVVFREKDAADHFYLVRVGFIKVSQKRPGGDHVLNYIGPGGYFGEIGLLSNLPEMRATGIPPGVRIATCSALDHVDLVRISGQALAEIVESYPEIRQALMREAEDRLRQNEAAREELDNQPLSQFVGQGLMNAQSLLVLDLEKCTRCDECTKACADAHDGVTRLIREGMRFENWLVASSCRSCLDPYCMVGCPVDSIHRLGSREMVIEDWCIGCGNCAKNCPYGNINMHPFPTSELAPDVHGKMVPVLQQKATMCDLCREIDGQPSCVYACPHDAAHRYSGDEFRELIVGPDKAMTGPVVMYERFTDRARKVLQLANSCAHRFNHDRVETEHLLLGLLHEGSGVAANVLVNLGLEVRSTYQEVVNAIQPGPDLILPGKLPLGALGKLVVDGVVEEASNLRHSYPGSEHLLLSLLRVEEGLAFQVLTRLGLRLDAVREETLNLLGCKLLDWRVSCTVDATWLTWNDATVAKLARAIREARRWEDLPILADALEEAGCQNAEILGHCRNLGPHGATCWAIDLLLAPR